MIFPASINHRDDIVFQSKYFNKNGQKTTRRTPHLVYFKMIKNLKRFDISAEGDLSATFRMHYYNKKNKFA